MPKGIFTVRFINSNIRSHNESGIYILIYYNIPSYPRFHRIKTTEHELCCWHVLPHIRHALVGGAFFMYRNIVRRTIA